MKLTRRGERVRFAAIVAASLIIMGLLGHIETLGL